MKLSLKSYMQQLFVPLVFFGFLAWAAVAFAAHPLLTDDAGTMGTGKAQLELTGEYGYDKADGVTTKTRQGDAAFTYGISEAVDLVIDLPYLQVRTSDDTATITENGFSDTSLAMKWRFYEHDGLSLALKPGLTLLAGDDEEGLGAGKATYSLFFITSKEMDPWAFHLNLGYIRNENKLDEEKGLWHASIAATVALTEQLTAVANLGVESNPDKLAGTDPAFVLAGLTYALSETIDLDCGIKYGLNDPETDYTVLAGVTWKY
ncbi:MAG TPA: transporter [Desulfobulbaceae bacterium]|nr:transporter [Desulfobulbaceae bacterium]